MSRTVVNTVAVVASIAGALLPGSAAFADPLGYAPFSSQRQAVFEQIVGNSVDVGREAVELPSRLRRQIVAYSTSEGPGTVIVDTPNTRLLYVLGRGRAISYGTPVASSRAQSPRNCRSHRWPSSNWSSTPRPPGCLVSPFRHPCSPAPTR